MVEKSSPCHLQPEKLKEMTSSVSSLGDCHFHEIPGHKVALFREKWDEHLLGQRSTLAEQAWFLYHANDSFEKFNEWTITFADVGSFLGVPRQTVRTLVLRWDSVLSGNNQNVGGRPRLFNDNQITQIKDHIASCEKKFKPPTQKKLLAWVNETFDVNTSTSCIK